MSELTESARKRIHVWVTGRVQGVGFRYTTREIAVQHGLGGWVRNLSDGGVEAVFEGPSIEVARAIAWCRQGPPGAWVSDLRTEAETPIGEQSFEVRSTQPGGAKA